MFVSIACYVKPGGIDEISLSRRAAYFANSS
jgi:hypothetical protein